MNFTAVLTSGFAADLARTFPQTAVTSFNTAMDRVADIVVGTVPGYTPRGLGGFTHYSDAQTSGLMSPPTRGFWLDVAAIESNARFSSTGSRRTYCDLDLYVHYEDHLDRSTLTKMMVSDYIAIRNRLADPDLWGRPSSSIVSLTTADNVMRVSIESEQDGSRRLHFTIPLEFTEQTA